MMIWERKENTTGGVLGSPVGWAVETVTCTQIHIQYVENTSSEIYLLSF